MVVRGDGEVVVLVLTDVEVVAGVVLLVVGGGSCTVVELEEVVLIVAGRDVEVVLLVPAEVDMVEDVPNSARCSSSDGWSRGLANASSAAPSRTSSRARTVSPSGASTRRDRVSCRRRPRPRSARFPTDHRAQPRARGRPRTGRHADGPLEVTPDARWLSYRQRRRPDRGGEEARRRAAHCFNPISFQSQPTSVRVPPGCPGPGSSIPSSELLFALVPSSPSRAASFPPSAGSPLSSHRR